MKSKGAFLVCVVAIILIVVLLITDGDKKEPQNNVGNNVSGTPTLDSRLEEFVKIHSDGSKENTSNQLKKAKTVEGVELTNIKLVRSAGITQLSADAKNTTSSKIEQLDIIITAIDKNGNILAEFEASVYELAAGSTTKLNAGTTSDVANAYDFTVRKK